jgi:hypothetical protein
VLVAGEPVRRALFQAIFPVIGSPTGASFIHEWNVAGRQRGSEQGPRLAVSTIRLVPEAVRTLLTDRHPLHDLFPIGRDPAPDHDPARLDEPGRPALGAEILHMRREPPLGGEITGRSIRIGEIGGDSGYAAEADDHESGQDRRHTKPGEE